MTLHALRRVLEPQPRAGRESAYVVMQPVERPAYQRHLEAAPRAVPSSAAFHRAWAIGRTLPLDAVVALAKELVTQPLPKTVTATSDMAQTSVPRPRREQRH